ncbi:MAG TPA: ATP-dependent Clp protease ATP-binding subunit [Candidatus Pacebacteria bacterium]|nr:ATP-dependent Clp protease ATP-binding subunit [Candidatus Paceibacterota bacterium]
MSQKNSITTKLTLHARKSMMHAEKIASANESATIALEHLLYGIFLERGSVGTTILKNIGLSKKIFETHIFADKITKKEPFSKIKLSKEVKKIITDAHALAAEFGYNYVGTEHLVYALLNTENSTIQKILASAKPTKRNKQPNMSPSMPSGHPGLFGIENLSALMGNEVAIDSSLDQFCTNISKQAKEPFIGGKADIERIVTILGRKNKNNPMIIGEPGIGKTAIIEHIAHLAKNPDAPHYLYGKEIITLDLTSLVAGTNFRGEFEQRLKNIITEAGENSNIILFIDEIHTIIGTGNTGGSLDAANILKPALARGNVRIIGATTLGEYKKHIEKDPALERRFQKIILNEPCSDDTRKILDGVKGTFEAHHNITIPKDALDATIEYSIRYLPERFFPDKAIDVLDETAARLCNIHAKNNLQREIISLENDLQELIAQKTALVRGEQYLEASKLKESEDALKCEISILRKKMQKEIKQNKLLMTRSDVAETVAVQANIPKAKILQTATKTLSEASKKLGRQIIGQDAALSTITDTLVRSASGICNEDRPNGSFLFLGTTGTGKTLTAKLLAKELYDNTDALIRVDMSELMERHQVSKLLGAPAGYVGYGEGGTLTEKIRRNPHSVVLFDEIEKAHPDVFNILLQILEDGTLTDASGRVINFKNTIVILTSNVGSTDINNIKNLGFNSTLATAEEYAKKINTASKEILSPELLSRLDHIIVFNQLTKIDLKKITRLELNKLKKLLGAKNITLTFTTRVITHIVNSIVTKQNGARGVRQFIQEHIEGKIAHHIIANPDNTALEIDYVKDSITLT